MHALVEMPTRSTPALPPPPRRARRLYIPVLVTAAVYAAMPAAHLHVFGIQRVESATIRMIETANGADLSAAARTLVHAQLASQTSAVMAAAGLTATMIAVLFAGLALTAAGVLAGTDNSPAETLTAAAAAHAVVGLVRFALWAEVVAALGRDAACAPDWLHVAPITLASLLGWTAGSSFTATVAAATDVTLFPGLVVAAAVLMRFDQRLSLPRACAVAAAWPVTVIAWRLVVAGIFGAVAL